MDTCFGPPPCATANARGGVTLIYRDSPLFQLENEKVQGPNLITFELVVGEKELTERWFVVGAYIAPSDRDGSIARRIEELVTARPKDLQPFVLANLNANLDCPRDRQEEILAGEWRGMGSFAPADMLWHGGPGT